MVRELVIQPLQYVPLIASRVFADSQMRLSSPAEFLEPMLHLIKQMEDLICQMATNLRRLEIWEGWHLPYRDDIWDMLRLQWVCGHLSLAFVG